MKCQGHSPSRYKTIPSSQADRYSFCMKMADQTTGTCNHWYVVSKWNALVEERERPPWQFLSVSRMIIVQDLAEDLPSKASDSIPGISSLVGNTVRSISPLSTRKSSAERESLIPVSSTNTQAASLPSFPSSLHWETNQMFCCISQV